MADTIEDRACELAVYMIETGATVRAAAKRFGISKSTVHKDLSSDCPNATGGFIRRYDRYWKPTRHNGISGAVWPPRKNTVPRRSCEKGMGLPAGSPIRLYRSSASCTGFS